MPAVPPSFCPSVLDQVRLTQQAACHSSCPQVAPPSMCMRCIPSHLQGRPQAPGLEVLHEGPEGTSAEVGGLKWHNAPRAVRTRKQQLMPTLSCCFKAQSGRAPQVQLPTLEWQSLTVGNCCPVFHSACTPRLPLPLALQGSAHAGFKRPASVPLEMAAAGAGAGLVPEKFEVSTPGLPGRRLIAAAQLVAPCCCTFCQRPG